MYPVIFPNDFFFEDCSHVVSTDMLFIPQFQGTGNVILDMEQQLQANRIRIEVLEQENTTLHGSLVKLRERAQSNASRVGRMICNFAMYV